MTFLIQNYHRDLPYNFFYLVESQFLNADNIFKTSWLSNFQGQVIFYLLTSTTGDTYKSIA